jgi:diguanylate cyclase (GGDEF)-like protein/PAS domain S-box-containing protein
MPEQSVSTPLVHAVAPAILIVDDNAVKRMALRAMLAPLGHSIVEVDSGRAALDVLLRETFAIILMDVRMPALDGFETAKLCRQQARGARTPIIFVTALDGDGAEVSSAYASGAVDFITTPVRADVLRAKVSAFIELFLRAQELQRSLESITALNVALRDSEVLTQAVLDNVSDGIFILDDNDLIQSANRSAGRLFGYEANEPVGHPFGFVIAAESRQELRACTAQAAQLAKVGMPNRGIETRGCRFDGSSFAMELERREVTHGPHSFTLAAVRDISERKAHTDALEHLALHDPLTGLANRALFGDLLARALALARRNGEQRAVLVMDLDGFKLVNDTLGHERGDKLLKQLSERLLAMLRDADAVARLGGDEFAILPAGDTDLAAAVAVAWKIQEACDDGFVFSDEPVAISPSIGIALFPGHGETAKELMHRADLAMYAAKRSGQGHCVFHAVQETETADHLALLLDLRHCIVREELVLHYQPKIDLATRRVTGVEALIRWQHPTQGLLAPAIFMPEVERTQLIEQVTRWVLNEALAQQQTWREEGFDLAMAVNISARSLSVSTSLPDAIAQLATTWRTSPNRLTLELTEGALVGAAASDVLKRLHDMGPTISIDDFGTGYSSLAYLQRLPVDEIKIDKSFVGNLAALGDDAIIVRSTIALAHSLGLTVVAEGVEDEDCATLLLEYGCDAAQGYLFGRPVPAAQLTERLATSLASTQRAVTPAASRTVPALAAS